MDEHLNSAMAREHRADLMRAADSARRAAGGMTSADPRPGSLVAHVRLLVRRHRLTGALRLMPPAHGAHAGAVTLRTAVAADFPALARLAALDSCPVPRHPSLIAVVGNELRAALSLADGQVAADPFQHTDGLVALLRERRRQLEVEARDAGPDVRRRVTSTVALRAARSQ